MIGVFVIAALASCKKETNAFIQPQNLSMADQVANVIKKADPDLYSKVYGSQSNAKKPNDGVRYLPGVFYIPQGTGPTSGIDNATCLGTDNVCMVIITSPKSMAGSVSELTSNIDETYETTTAQLILNDGESPTVKQINSIKVNLDNGVSLSYE